FDVRHHDLLSVFVECPRIPQRLAGRQWAKARIEVIKVPLDQFQRNHLRAQLWAERLVAVDVAADGVACEESAAAKEGVTGPFVVHPFRQCLDLETLFGEPGVEDGRLAGPLAMPESGAIESVAK